MTETYTYKYTLSQQELAALRSRRAAARKRRERRRRLLLGAAALAASAALLTGGALWLLTRDGPAGEPAPIPPAGEIEDLTEPAAPPDIPASAPAAIPAVSPPHEAVQGPDTARLASEIDSRYAILIDLDTGEILAQKMPGALVSPASMTKILTILTAADHIGGLNGTYVITQEMVDYCRSNGCSTAGFLPGEEVSLTDLFYGTILPSGADAALALACYVAGSQEAFVELMNQKARELGLSSSARFANCIGLYDPDNVCTVYDMAMILWAAMENNVCRTFLTERNRVLPPNGVREEELDLSNWFIRRIEDHMPEGLAVLGAKTGYVSMAGSCAASFAQSRDGREYICVTAKASGGWQCIFDQAAIYAAWAGR